MNEMCTSTQRPPGLHARRALWRAGALTLTLLQSSMALADDPATFTSVVRWDMNDSIGDGILDNTSNGRDGTVSGSISSSSDTPKSSGYSLRFNGSAYVYGIPGEGDFFDSSVDSKTHTDYSTPYYVDESGSRTISLWVKQDDDDLTENVALFYHGAGPGGYFTCGVDTGQASACRGFSVMLTREVVSSQVKGWVTVGSPDGGAFTLTSSNRLNDCSSTNVNMADGEWHHVAAIYSAELTALEASYNTIVFIDGVKCGHGLIPMPHTDVGGPNNDTGNSLDDTSLWYFGAKQQTSGSRFDSGNLSSDYRFNGWLDEVRVYEHVLTPTAVTWLKNNTGD